MKNREILFRGKRVDGKGWVYGYYLFVSNKYHQILSGKWHRQSGSPYSHEVIPETVGQFTGLTDKNGAKIFEGDILSCINPNDGEIYTTGIIASLINGITFTNTKLTRELAMYECEWPDELQITGNIHDNPTT